MSHAAERHICALAAQSNLILLLVVAILCGAPCKAGPQLHQAEYLATMACRIKRSRSPLCLWPLTPCCLVFAAMPGAGTRASPLADLALRRWRCWDALPLWSLEQSWSSGSVWMYCSRAGRMVRRGMGGAEGGEGAGQAGGRGQRGGRAGEGKSQGKDN